MPQTKDLHRVPPAILQRRRDFGHPLKATEGKVRQAVRLRQLGFEI